MKRVLLLLSAWLVAAGAAWAYDVVFLPADNDSVSYPLSAISKNGVTLTFTQEMPLSAQFRVYKGHDMIVTSQVGIITRITLECTAEDTAKYGPGNFITNLPDYYWYGKTGLWSGVADCVIFHAETAQVRMTKITVTVSENGLAAPVFSPPGGTYYTIPIEVSMSCTSNGAEIYYTTDGSTPTTASTRYVAPIAVSAPLTIKAVAARDGELSDVVSATYDLIDPDQATTLADALALEPGTSIRITGPVIVLAQNKSYLFVKDETAFAQIYGDTGQTYHHGDIIPGGFVVTSGFYSGEPELISPHDFKPAIGYTPVEAEEIDDVIGHELFGHYVVVHNVQLEEDGNVITAVGENGIVYPVYCGTLGVQPPTDLSTPCDLYAIVGSYGYENTIYQLLPVSFGPGIPEQRIGFGDLPYLTGDPNNPNPEVTMGYDATVIYQSGPNLFAKDETGYGLVYGDTGHTYKMGDVIPAGFGGEVKMWSCHPEISRPTGFEPAQACVDVQPEEIKLSQVDEEHWAHYVVVRNVYFDPIDNVLRDDEGNEIPYYNRMGIFLPEDCSRTYNVYGVVESYGNKCTHELVILDWGPKPDYGVFTCLEDFYEMVPQGAVATVKLVVAYQNGVNLYVKDACDRFGLIYGNIGLTLANGDTICGRASCTTYQGQYQLSPQFGTWKFIGHGPKIEPIEIPIEDISQDMCHHYVRLVGAKIIKRDGNWYAQDETGEMLLFDKFDVEIMGWADWDQELTIADVNALIEWIITKGPACPTFNSIPDSINPNSLWDIDGFLTVYRNNLELYPVKIAHHYSSMPLPGGKYDVNQDGEVTIADVNLLIDIIFY